MAIENCVTFLPCSDIKKTTHFYRDIVGLPVVQEQAGGMLKIFDTGYGYWGFCQYGDGRPIPSGDVGVCLSLNCHDEEDVDRQYARMTEKGLCDQGTTETAGKVSGLCFFYERPG